MKKKKNKTSKEEDLLIQEEEQDEIESDDSLESEEEFIKKLTVKANSLETNSKVDRKSSFIRYKINEKDDDILKTLKHLINKKNITLQMLSKKVGDNAYNLYYYYTKSNTISLENLKKWLKVLGMKMEISFLPDDDIDDEQ